MNPLELPRRALHMMADEGALVGDCFMGSGTTMLAAETLGMECFGIERDAGACDVAVARWCRATRQPAILESTGERFPMPAEAVV